MAIWKCVVYDCGKARVIKVKADSKPDAYAAARAKVHEMEKRGKIGRYSILDGVSLVRG